LSSPALTLGTEDCSECRFFLEATCRNQSAALASRSVQTFSGARTASVFNGWINVFTGMYLSKQVLARVHEKPLCMHPHAKAHRVRAYIALSPSRVVVAWPPSRASLPTVLVETHLPPGR